MKAEDVIGHIAAKHGVIIDRDDPIMAVISTILLINAEHEAKITAVLDRITSSHANQDIATRVERAMGANVEVVRQVVQNGVNWSTDPTTRYQWLFGALVAAIALFGMGFVIGKLM